MSRELTINTQNRPLCHGNGKGNVYLVKVEQSKSVYTAVSEREPNSVVIVDQRATPDSKPASEHNPNMQIIDSYKVDDFFDQLEICIIMYHYNEANPVNPGWNRTVDSMVKEWDIHNRMYRWGISKDRTGSCDFDNEDEGKGYFSFFMDWLSGRYPQKEK